MVSLNFEPPPRIASLGLSTFGWIFAPPGSIGGVFSLSKFCLCLCFNFFIIPLTKYDLFDNLVSSLENKSFWFNYDWKVEPQRLKGKDANCIALFCGSGVVRKPFSTRVVVNTLPPKRQPWNNIFWSKISAPNFPKTQPRIRGAFLFKCE